LLVFANGGAPPALWLNAHLRREVTTGKSRPLSRAIGTGFGFIPLTVLGLRRSLRRSARRHALFTSTRESARRSDGMVSTALARR